jgi:hypothetical protein
MLRDSPQGFLLVRNTLPRSAACQKLLWQSVGRLLGISGA